METRLSLWIQLSTGLDRFTLDYANKKRSEKNKRRNYTELDTPYKNTPTEDDLYEYTPYEYYSKLKYIQIC